MLQYSHVCGAAFLGLLISPPNFAHAQPIDENPLSLQFLPPTVASQFLESAAEDEIRVPLLDLGGVVDSAIAEINAPEPGGHRPVEEIASTTVDNTRLATSSQIPGVRAAAHKLAVNSSLPGAREQAESSGDRRLTVAISPFYGWVTGVRGTVTALGVPAKINKSPWSIISDLDEYFSILDGIYMGMGEIKYGRFGLFYDIYYFDISFGDAIDAGFFSVDFEVAFDHTMATVAATYELARGPRGHVDALAGLRLSDVDLNVGITINEDIGVNLLDGAAWVDPLIGANGRYNFSDNVFASGWLMIGGFGVSSRIIADAMVTMNYQSSSWLGIYGGYRVAHTDFHNGKFGWDVTFHGPVIGFNVSF